MRPDNDLINEPEDSDESSNKNQQDEKSVIDEGELPMEYHKAQATSLYISEAVTNIYYLSQKQCLLGPQARDRGGSKLGIQVKGVQDTYILCIKLQISPL